MTVTIKPRIRFIFGSWRASVGAHHAVGRTPVEAYKRLLAYMGYLEHGRTHRMQ